MDNSIAHKGVTMTAPSSSRNASNTNIIGDCDLNIDNKGNCNRTHIGHDNRDNQGVVVTGGSASKHTVSSIFSLKRNRPNQDITVHGESSDALNELRWAPAYYDSSIRKQAQQCMQETRVAILNIIYDWIDSHDNPPIFWLHGPPGTGKSTIAHTVAQECRRRGRLGASFFFAHANAECSDPNLFFSTIAYQLSKSVPDLRQHITDGVKGHPSPQDASISTQFEEFILTPLRKLSNGPAREPIIVVVDALDECSDARKASEILQLISAKIPGFPLWLKFLITSRPESEIRSILHPDIDRISRSFDLLQDVGASSTDEDIKRFLRFHLGRIGKDYYFPSWPRQMDVEGLAQQAGGLFIFANTAIELIKDKDVKDPESQLTMLKNIGTNGTPAFNLNALYSRILQKTVPETASTTVQGVITIIHAIVGLRAPLAMCAIERLLGLNHGAIRTALNQLRSIFILPDSDEDTVQVIHPSFARYIADEESCAEKRFVVGGRLLHTQLAKHCLKQMKTHLKLNICNFKDFTTVEAPIKVDKESSDILQTLSEELKYSCENFAAHVFSADWQDRELCEMVVEWANEYLPYWLEVLALIGSFRDALTSLRLLSNFNGIASASHDELPATDDEPSGYGYAEPPRADDSHYRVQAQISKSAQSKSRQSSLRPPPKRRKVESAHQPLLTTERLKAITAAPNQGSKSTESPQLLADAIRMVSESYDDIKKFPHQIYTSCLTFCPLDSTLFKQYSRLSTVRVLSGKRKHWRPLLHSFKDPDGDVISLTFSPDGKILASCSSVGKILLWNLETRESYLLASHTSCRDPAFTFSPDGKYVAADGNVYRVTTGEEVLTPGVCSAFSSNGLYVAIGCDDGTIGLHDMQEPNLSLFGELSGHGGTVTTLAFSSDNKVLASTSSDDTIRVWNCSSREMMKQIPCPESGYATFSPYGTYVAAHYESFVSGKGFETYVWVADIQTGEQKSIEVSTDRNQFDFAGSTLTTTILSSSGDYVAFCNNGALYVIRQADSARLTAGSDVVRWVAETDNDTDRFLSRRSGSVITSISFTPDEQSLLVGNEKGLIRSWRIPKYGRSADTFDFECKAHFDAVQAIAFSHNAKYFASASNDGSICVWDSTSVDLHEPDLTQSSDFSPQTITFAPDGQTVAIETLKAVSKMDATTGRSIFHKKTDMYHRPKSSIFSADGKYLASSNFKELLFSGTRGVHRATGGGTLRHMHSHQIPPIMRCCFPLDICGSTTCAMVKIEKWCLRTEELDFGKLDSRTTADI